VAVAVIIVNRYSAAIAHYLKQHIKLVRLKNKYEKSADRPFLGTEVLKRCHTKENPSTHLIADDLISYNVTKINMYSTLNRRTLASRI